MARSSVGDAKRVRDKLTRGLPLTEHDTAVLEDMTACCICSRLLHVHETLFVADDDEWPACSSSCLQEVRERLRPELWR